MLRELTRACRFLWRTPLLTGLTLVALTFGVGAATALFSVVDAVLLRPLPYGAPEQLVAVAASEDRGSLTDASADVFALTGAEADGVRAMSDVFAGVAVFESWKHSRHPQWALTGAAHGERLRGALVDGNYFDVLGLTARIGRTFTALDDDDGVVISDGLWARQFQRRADVLGMLLHLDAVPRPVVGVLPPGARITYPEETDIFVRRAATVVPRAVSYGVVARLRPGVSPDVATTAVARLRAARLDGVRPHMRVVGLADHLTSPVAGGVWMVALAAGLLCVAASANAALLMLIRTARRSREHWIRLALGASRYHLLRHVAFEQLVVASIAACGGAAIAAALHPLVLRLAPASMPRLDESGVDGRALAFAVTTAVLSCVVSGLVSYVIAIRHEGRLAAGRLGAAATPGTSVARWRAMLLGAQVAVLVVLLSTASLLLYSYLNAWRIDLGFDPRDVVAVQLSPAVQRTEMNLTRGTGAPVMWEESARRLAQSVAVLRDELRARFGADAVASVQAVPFERAPGYTSVPQGGPDAVAGPARVDAVVREVSDAFFDVMRTPILTGRAISSDDVAQSRRVTVLSRRLAEHLYPGGTAIGRRLHWGEAYEIVGIAADTRWDHPERPGPAAFYVPANPQVVGVQQILIRTATPVREVAGLVRPHLRRIDALQPIDRVVGLQEVVERATSERRFYAGATSTFSVFALVLAVIAVFGGAAASVTERMREFAIRLALGASVGSVRWHAMREALLPVGIGLLVGVALSAFVARSLRAFLFEISANDPTNTVVAVAFIGGVAVAGAWWPATRATRVPPASILRAE